MGVLSGYHGGKIDVRFMRVVDVLMAFPFLVLVIAIMSILGPGLTNLYIAVGVVGGSTYAAFSAVGIPAVLAEVGGQGLWPAAQVQEMYDGLQRARARRAHHESGRCAGYTLHPRQFEARIGSGTLRRQKPSLPPERNLLC